MVVSKSTRWLDLFTTHAVLGIFSVIALFPVLYTLMTSFKSAGDVLTRPPSFFPTQGWSLEGYQVVLNSDMVRHYLPNSFVNSFVASLVVVLLAALAAYAFSRYHFRGSRVLEFAILGLMMVPGLTFLVPYYRMSSQLGNPAQFIIAVYIAWGLPFAIWIIRSFIDSIPMELEEAAAIDGCTPLQAMQYVVLPLARPGLLAGFLLVFVDTWNEFLLALVLLNGDARTATVGLYDFQGQFEIAYHVWTAACILIMVPVLLLFLTLRKTFFQAMLNGAVKG
ncbi:MAG: carbohydrate ABC transporter permease [Anaerolineae bacterium]|nr:carbohydrate ABC transporter permease [Anaerolineae bacterium]